MHRKLVTTGWELKGSSRSDGLRDCHVLAPEIVKYVRLPGESETVRSGYEALRIRKLLYVLRLYDSVDRIN